MPRLVAAFMRHGAYCQPADVPSAHLPHPLSPKGTRQAEAGAREVVDWATAAGLAVHTEIDASALLRAWQTAEICAAKMTAAGQPPFTVRPYTKLAERSLGSAANLTMDEIAAVIAADPRWAPLPPGWKRDSRFRLPLPGAESLIQSGRRVARHVTRRMRELEGAVRRDTVKLFVGHGGAFRHAACALGILQLDQAAGLSMHHCRPIFFEWEATTRWLHVGGEWKQRPSLKD